MNTSKFLPNCDELLIRSQVYQLKKNAVPLQLQIVANHPDRSGQQRQFAEDRNSGMNLLSRSSSKASEYYDNASWDLIDALENGKVTLEAILDSDLPEIMRGMTLTEKRAYVAAKKTERQAIQRKIRELSQKRNEYIDRQRKANTEQGENTVDRVIIQSLTQQLAAKGFKLN